MINHCDDDRVLGRALLLLTPAVLLTAASLFAQKPELMPTVRVRPASTSPAPSADCTTGLAPAPPRLEIEAARPAEMPRAAERASTASRDTASLFRRVQDAAEADDRASFKSALESAHTASRSLDAGNQKTRAEELLRVYDDIERVWDYSFATPTGSFFSAETQGGTLLTALSRYPGYTDFIGKESLVDQAGVRFYPSREARLFLTSLAARLLLGARLGPAASAPQAARGLENGPPAGTARTPQRERATSTRREHRGSSSSTSKPSRRPGTHEAAAGSASTSVSPHRPAAAARSGRKGAAGHESSGSRPETMRPPSMASGGAPHVGASARPAIRKSPSTAPSPGPARSAAPPPTSHREPAVATTAHREPVAAATTHRHPDTASSSTASINPVTATTAPLRTAAPAPAPTTATTPAPASTPPVSATTSAATSASSSPTSTQSDSSGTTSTVSQTTGSETTTSRNEAPLTEPAVPSGGRTYLSILMVAIGLIVLIVLIRASK